jgi:hypothetical protein
MIAKIVLGERLGKGCGRKRRGGLAGLGITCRDKAVTGKTIGDEPEQIFHKGSRFSRTRCCRVEEQRPRATSAAEWIPRGERGAGQVGGCHRIFHPLRRDGFRNGRRRSQPHRPGFCRLCPLEGV